LRCRSAIRSRSAAQAGVPADIIGFRAQKATFWGDDLIMLQLAISRRYELTGLPAWLWW
jgi:hypothetical protein